MEIRLEPIAFVRSPRTEILDDDWGDVQSSIVLAEHLPEDALLGLTDFSHVEVLYFFHQVQEKKIVPGARHPRNNPEWPRIGIFAQRGKNRPNRLGATMVRVLSCEGRTLHVQGLDAIDGTPVLDLKPVFREFLPREPVQQPAWTGDLMQGYWSPSSAAGEKA